MPDNATSPGAPPVLDLFQTGGPVPIQEVEGGWLLDLGQVEAGSLLPTFRVGVQNLAEAPADAVAVRLDVAGDPAFRIFAPDSFEAIGPQEGAGSVDTILDTSKIGRAHD